MRIITVLVCFCFLAITTYHDAYTKPLSNTKKNQENLFKYEQEVDSFIRKIDYYDNALIVYEANRKRSINFSDDNKDFSKQEISKSIKLIKQLLQNLPKNIDFLHLISFLRQKDIAIAIDNPNIKNSNIENEKIDDLNIDLSNKFYQINQLVVKIMYLIKKYNFVELKLEFYDVVIESLIINLLQNKDFNNISSRDYTVIYYILQLIKRNYELSYNYPERLYHLGKLYNNIAFISFKLNEYNLAVYSYLLALDISLKVNDELMMNESYYNLATTYQLLRENEKYEEIDEKIKTIEQNHPFKKLIKDKATLSKTVQNVILEDNSNYILADKIKLLIVDKVTTKSYTYLVQIGSMHNIQELRLNAIACIISSSKSRENVKNALLSISTAKNDKKDNNILQNTEEKSQFNFMGWLMVSNKSANTINHPRYDIILLDCFKK